MSLRTPRKSTTRPSRLSGRDLPRELSRLNISPADWWIVVSAQLNVLVEGVDAETDLVVTALKSRAPVPIRHWTGRPPDLPGGTLIVRGAEKLDARSQRALLEYLTTTRGRHPVQVVSTSSQLLFPMIERGDFLEELYYRLNTVRIDLNERV